MTEEDLLRVLERPMGKASVERLAGIVRRSGFPLNNLLDITFYRQPEIAFRAAWVLEYVVLGSPDCPTVFLGDFLVKYPVQKNKSCCRHYSKMMIHLLKHRQLLDGISLEQVTEATFEWLIDPYSPVGVKVNCLDILLGLSRDYPWIRDELRMQTEFLMTSGTAAMQARGKKILRQLA